MKNLILAKSLFFLTLSVFGQNGMKNGKLFLLLKDDRTISINSFENDKVNEIKTFAISEKSIYTTDQKERIAILDTAKNEVNIFEIKSSKHTTLSIPFEIKPKTVLLNNDNFFIGGEMGKEILVQYHLKSEKWFQLEIPEEVKVWGKAIDDLVINDTLLIAVDNIVLPKYILYYNLNSNEKLNFSHFKELKSNSSYESIHKARITNKYLGLLSTTMNHGTVREHITLYADLDLKESFAISVEYSRNMTFNDFLLVDNKLFIANSSKGLGKLNIDKSYFKKSEYSYDNFNAQIKESRVNYKKIKDGEVIRLTRIPNEQKIVLTIMDFKGKIRNEIREI